MSVRKHILTGLLSLAFFVGVSAIGTPRAYAENNINTIPLEIVPVCSDEHAATAKWQVNNKNNSTVQIDWDNFENDLTGSFTATPGLTSMFTGFVKSDPNNTTRFYWAGHETQTNATQAACQTEPVVVPEQPTCIDGTKHQNLVVKWNGIHQVTVHTLNHQPLCANVQLYFSSYTMPDHYDGGSFYGNPTAIPQPLFHSVHATLLQGTDGLQTLTVNLPHSCKNIQTDVYYGPEIHMVNANGHGSQNLASQVQMKTQECEVPGGRGGVEPAPVVPAVASVVTPSPAPSVHVAATPAPATLADTGEQAWLGALAGVVLLIMAAAVRFVPVEAKK